MLSYAFLCQLSGVGIYKYAKNLPVGVYDAVKVLYPWQADIAVVQPQSYINGCEHSCKKEYPHCIAQITEDEVYKILSDRIRKCESGR